MPILINDETSVFRVSDYLTATAYEGASGYGGAVDQTSGWRKRYRRFARRLSEAEIPGFDFNVQDRIFARKPDARLLCIGSGELSIAGRVTNIDVAFAPGIVCIADAHDLPFEDGSYDGVFIGSVLEHVCDPQRCVEEITRILTPGGYVMAVTPFLQGVHMGAYDFTRFTFLGHRRLFRHYDEIESGICGGPAYAMIKMIRDIATSITDRPRIRSVLRLASLLVTYPMRHLDRVMSRTQAAYNVSAGFFFFGQKRTEPIPDREIIAQFRGR